MGSASSHLVDALVKATIGKVVDIKLDHTQLLELVLHRSITLRDAHINTLYGFRGSVQQLTIQLPRDTNTLPVHITLCGIDLYNAPTHTTTDAMMDSITAPPNPSDGAFSSIKRGLLDYLMQDIHQQQQEVQHNDTMPEAQGIIKHLIENVIDLAEITIKHVSFTVEKHDCKLFSLAIKEMNIKKADRERILTFLGDSNSANGKEYWKSIELSDIRVTLYDGADSHQIAYMNPGSLFAQVISYPEQVNAPPRISLFGEFDSIKLAVDPLQIALVNWMISLVSKKGSQQGSYTFGSLEEIKLETEDLTRIRIKLYIREVLVYVIQQRIDAESKDCFDDIDMLNSSGNFLRLKLSDINHDSKFFQFASFHEISLKSIMFEQFRSIGNEKSSGIPIFSKDDQDEEKNEHLKLTLKLNGESTKCDINLSGSKFCLSFQLYRIFINIYAQIIESSKKKSAGSSVQMNSDQSSIVNSDQNINMTCTSLLVLFEMDDFRDGLQISFDDFKFTLFDEIISEFRSAIICRTSNSKPQSPFLRLSGSSEFESVKLSCVLRDVFSGVGSFSKGFIDTFICLSKESRIFTSPEVRGDIFSLLSSIGQRAHLNFNLLLPVCELNLKKDDLVWLNSLKSRISEFFVEEKHTIEPFDLMSSFSSNQHSTLVGLNGNNLFEYMNFQGLPSSNNLLSSWLSPEPSSSEKLNFFSVISCERFTVVFNVEEEEEKESKMNFAKMEFQIEGFSGMLSHSKFLSDSNINCACSLRNIKFDNLLEFKHLELTEPFLATFNFYSSFSQNLLQLRCDIESLFFVLNDSPDLVQQKISRLRSFFSFNRDMNESKIKKDNLSFAINFTNLFVYAGAKKCSPIIALIRSLDICDDGNDTKSSLKCFEGYLAKKDFSFESLKDWNAMLGSPMVMRFCDLSDAVIKATRYVIYLFIF
jgi:hypothetical protein